MSSPGTAPPTALTVEHETEPNGVDPTEPVRFSWRCATDARDAAQTAYRLVVAREREPAAGGVGDLWDSGRVESDRATGVRYRGPDLAATETYWWAVRVWDESGAASEWSDPARFATAPADESDWEGDWISHRPGPGDSQGWRSRWRPPEFDGEEWVQVDLGETRRIAEVEIHPADPFGDVESPDGVRVTPSFGSEDVLAGLGFPERYRVAVADDPAFDNPTVVVERTDDGDDPTAPRTAGTDARGRYVRVTATALGAFDPAVITGSDGDEQSAGVWRLAALSELVVRDGDGENLARGRPVSASSSVETESWGAERLVDGVVGSATAAESPLLRTEFDLDGTVARAHLHAATLGYGECYVNGERVGDAVLDPAWTRYDERTAFSTVDVTEAVSSGANALGVWLGRGWFSKRGRHLWSAYGSPRARVQLVVEFADGDRRTVASGPEWDAAHSPVETNDIYDGERYDARRERDGWAEPGFEPGGGAGADRESGTDWEAAVAVDGPGGSLEPQRIEPMRVVETFDVAAVTEREDGPILDFGQNLTGWVELTVTDPDRGREVTLRHAEALTEDGDLSTVDLRSADATDTYVAAGRGAETYEPRFTYHGFRYVQVTGYPGELDPDDVTAKAVHTAMDRRGDFECASDDLERVQHNAVWGLRGNTHSVPEDCPQRDERLGWTGDAHVSGRALLFNFDAVRFQEKWQRDHDDAQSERGSVAEVIPNQVPGKRSDPTWSITRVVLPWYCYLHDGDRRVLKRHYEPMRRYVDYWHDRLEDGILPDEYGEYGDWLAFENCDGRRGLPYDLFNTAFHYQVVDTFARVADVLGNEVDAERYRERAETVRDAFDREFFDADAGVYGPGTQSSYAVPLFLGLVPDDRTAAVVENLVEKVEADGGRLRTGFLGTRPLILTLAEHGHADLAYHLVSQPERPGWVYMARNGATTMWERWDSDDQVGSGMNSLNHSPFTFVSEFFYEVLVGIRLRDDDRSVTDRVRIEPKLVEGLDGAAGSVETPNGDVASEWERVDGGYRLSVAVPWNVTAAVRLPDATPATVRSGTGHPASDEGDGERSDERDGESDDVADVAGVRDVRAAENDLVLTVGSGEYEFRVR